MLIPCVANLLSLSLSYQEWEEKLNSSQETAEIYKEKYTKLKESLRAADGSRDTRSVASQSHQSTTEDDFHGYSSMKSSVSRAGSHASLGSGLANHARSIVGSFSCAGGNQRSGGIVAQELAEGRDAEIRDMAFRHDSGMRDRRRTSDSKRSGSHKINMSYSDRSFSEYSQSTGARRTPQSVASGSTRSKSSRSFREYSRSPQRVDF